MNEPTLRKRPLLLLCNKIDKEKTKKVEEVVEYLGLNDLNDWEWMATEVSAVTGEGIQESLIWIYNKIFV